MSVCEHPECSILADIYYGTGRFCSSRCARSFSSFAKRYEKNTKISNSMRRYMLDNPRKVLFGGIRPDSKKVSEGLKRYYQANPKFIIPREHLPALNREAVHRSRAKRRGQLPENANLKIIKKIYIDCPGGHVVDHIVALGVGGAHHEDNLQYLPTKVNHLKNTGQIYDKSQIIKWQSVIGVW